MLSIIVPKNIQLSVANGFIKMEGPFGVLIKKLGSLRVVVHNSRLYIVGGGRRANNLLSLFRGYFVGLSKGYSRKLRLVGVGYRAALNDKKLSLKVGFSHELSYAVPEDVSIVCSKAKGTIILIRGKELQRVNQVAAEIRGLRRPDSYKGKGIHYDREVLVLKKGKREGA